MPLLPLAMERSLRKRPLVSAVIGCVIIYQSLLLVSFPSLALPVVDFPDSSYTDPVFYTDFLLSLFRGAGAFSAFWLFLFWMICGPLLEEASGRTLLMVTFLAGAILPYFLAREGYIAWERSYWPGLGGTMACLGLGYYEIWEEDIKVFYAIPMLFKVGFASTSALFIMIIMHLLLSVAQTVTYPRSMPQLRPDGVSTNTWVLMVPILVLISALGFRQALRLFTNREAQAVQ